MRSGYKLGVGAVVAAAIAAASAIGLSKAQAQAPEGWDPVGVTDGGAGATGGFGGTGASGVGDGGMPGAQIPNGDDLPDHSMGRPQSGTEAIPPTTGTQVPAVPNPAADGGY